MEDVSNGFPVLEKLEMNYFQSKTNDDFGICLNQGCGAFRMTLCDDGSYEVRATGGNFKKSLYLLDLV